MSSQCDTALMCNRTDCYGSAFGPMACAVCMEGEMGCAICGHTATDTITLHCSADPWDSTQPYTVHLCRDHQGGLIGPVQEAIKKMKEDLNAQVSA